MANREFALLGAPSLWAMAIIGLIGTGFGFMQLGSHLDLWSIAPVPEYSIGYSCLIVGIGLNCSMVGVVLLRRPASKRYIYLDTQDGGYIGKRSQRSCLPPYYKELSMKDGSPIRLRSDDYFVRLGRCGLDLATFPDPLFLPNDLLKGKKDGETIELKFRGQLFSFVIDQAKNISSLGEVSFTEALTSQLVYVQEHCALDHPFFDKGNLLWFCAPTEKGKIFHMTNNQKTGGIDLTPSRSHQWHQGIDLNKVEKIEAKVSDSGKLILAIPFAMFTLDDITVTINEHHYLVFHGRTKKNSPLKALEGLGPITIQNTSVDPPKSGKT